MFVLAKLKKEGCKKRKWSKGGGRRKKGSGPLRLRRERRRKKDQPMLPRRLTRSQRLRRRRLRHPLKIPKRSEAVRALPERPRSKLRNRCVRFYLYNIDTSS
jgi:hypothetical protein